MTARTDPHRPGAIIPADYEPVLAYSLAHTVDQEPVPACGINCELEGRRDYRDADGVFHAVNGEHGPSGLCCIIGLRSIARVPWAPTGGTGKCSICGAVFTHGAVWRHTPSGEHIHLGRTCEAKYELLADWTEHEIAVGRLRSRAAAEAEKVRRARQREDTRADLECAHPGILADLDTDHPIVNDIRSRLLYGLSDRQIALVRKLADEVRNPPPAPVHVAAPRPEGRITIEGEIISTKVQEGEYGDSYKMTMKVTTEAGTWLAWGTIPEALLEAQRAIDCGPDGALHMLRGRRCRLTTALKPGREPHFAVLSRPGKAVLL